MNEPNIYPFTGRDGKVCWPCLIAAMPLLALGFVYLTGALIVYAGSTFRR